MNDGLASNGLKQPAEGKKEDRDKPEFIQSVIRATSILDCFIGDHTEYGLMEICRLTGLNKSTVHRLLSTLQAAGYISQNQENGKYGTGNQVLLLGLSATKHFELSKHAQPFLENLVAYSGETANLAIRDGDEMIYVCSIDSPKAVRISTIIGKRGFMHTSAVGKILLSGISDGAILRVVEKHGLHARTANSITDPDKLLEEIHAVRANGYAFDLEEDDEDMICVAAKVLDRNGTIVAGLSITGPKMRMMERLDELKDKVVFEARQFSYSIGLPAESY